MALPVVKTLTDCVDYSKTVSPYMNQVYDFPQQIVQTISNPQGLKVLYVATNPLISAFVFSIFLGAIFLVASEINKNYSQVDRFWSILPTVYNAHFALYAHAVGLPTQRLDTVLAISTLWSMRLTFNYWRKGGYNIGSEDYRWEILRKNISPALFFIFNVTFISFIQSVLLFSISLPSYVLLLASRLTGEGLSGLDMIFSSTIAALIATAATADQQQWNYQSAKAEYKKSGKVRPGYNQKDLDRGFLSSGLWAYSRHPNFAAEQSIWVCLYLWSCNVTQTYYNWSGVGALAYLALFQGSTWLTELITSGKYPEYAEYQKKVGMFVPVLSPKMPDSTNKKLQVKADQKIKK